VLLLLQLLVLVLMLLLVLVLMQLLVLVLEQPVLPWQPPVFVERLELPVMPLLLLM
jgi:hypothetical protein